MEEEKYRVITIRRRIDSNLNVGQKNDKSDNNQIKKLS